MPQNQHRRIGIVFLIMAAFALEDLAACQLE